MHPIQVTMNISALLMLHELAKEQFFPRFLAYVAVATDEADMEGR